MFSTPQELFWSTWALSENSQTCTYFSHAYSSIRASSSPSCGLNALPPRNLTRCRTCIRAFDRHSVNFIATGISLVCDCSDTRPHTASPPFLRTMMIPRTTTMTTRAYLAGSARIAKWSHGLGSSLMTLSTAHGQAWPGGGGRASPVDEPW